MFLTKRHSLTQKEGDHQSTDSVTVMLHQRVTFGEFTIWLHNKLEEQNAKLKLTFYWVIFCSQGTSLSVLPHSKFSRQDFGSLGFYADSVNLNRST